MRMASNMSPCSSTGPQAQEKVAVAANRPRLLSDILEVPQSESAVPEEYSTGRPFSPPHLYPTNLRHRAASGTARGLVGPHDEFLQPQRLYPALSLDPGVIGMATQQDRLPLPLHTPQMTSCKTEEQTNDRRRSTPGLLPIFGAYPAVSGMEYSSPSPFTTMQRSSSQTTLNSSRASSRPRTPTSSAFAGSKAPNRSLARSSSLPSSPKSRRATPHPHGKPSVKHLTCFWWKVKGDCRFSEGDCLYAHRDTGLLADAPRQVTPGGKLIYSLPTPWTEH
jgi:hypothetical protein